MISNLHIHEIQVIRIIAPTLSCGLLKTEDSNKGKRVLYGGVKEHRPQLGLYKN